MWRSGRRFVTERAATCHGLFPRMAGMDGPPHVSADIPGKREAERVDRRIGRLAERQHGVVGRGQLRRLGLGAGRIEDRLLAGKLVPLHRGVYAVGHGLVSPRGAWFAALIAAGPGATLSHRSAAAAWALGADPSSVVEVIVPHHRRQRRGIRVRHVPLAADERTVRDGIPVTTPARTLLDLASVLDRRRLARTVNEAEVQRVFDGRALAALLDRHPHRHGAPALRAVLAALDPGPAVIRSELEHRFRELLADHDLPPAELNARIHVPGHRYEVDALWRAQRLIAEVDGFATHATRRQFEEDRIRDLALQIAGWRVVRFTWRQLRDRPGEVAAGLTALLPLAST